MTTTVNKYSRNLELQFLLKTAGYSPGILDGVIGPKTIDALHRFQNAHHFAHCDPYTLSGETDNELRATLHVSAKAAQHGLPHLGLTEDPPGSNRTIFGDWYGHNGLPWCNIFVSWCFSAVGITLCDNFQGPGVRRSKGCSYVPTTQNWLMANNLTVPTQGIVTGDIIIYGWDGKSPAHIGIACGPADSQGNFQALEGNTAVGNDSNGGQVLLRTRNLKSVLTAGRIP